jgi:hypothetical protein
VSCAGTNTVFFLVHARHFVIYRHLFRCKKIWSNFNRTTECLLPGTENIHKAISVCPWYTIELLSLQL